MNSKDLYKVNGSESELGMIWEPEEEEFGRSRARSMRFSQPRRILSRPTKRPVRRPRRPIPRRRPRRPLPINFGTQVFTEPEPQSQGSEYVRWVQIILNQILNLRLPVHGLMDVQTRSAVRSFQEKNGLPVTGIVGPDTERALMGAKDAAAGAGKPEEPTASSSEPGGTASAEPDSAAPDSEFEWEMPFNSEAGYCPHCGHPLRESEFEIGGNIQLKDIVINPPSRPGRYGRAAKSHQKTMDPKKHRCKDGVARPCPKLPGLEDVSQVSGVGFEYIGGWEKHPGIILSKSTGKWIVVEKNRKKNRVQEMLPRAGDGLATFIANMKAINMPIEAILTMGSLVCRCIRGTTKLSNHSFGDAIDVGGVRFVGGKEVLVANSGHPADRKLLHRVNACLRLSFATVFDYHDATGQTRHWNHFHCDTNIQNGGERRWSMAWPFIRESLGLSPKGGWNKTTANALKQFAGADAVMDRPAIDRTLSKLFMREAASDPAIIPAGVGPPPGNVTVPTPQPGNNSLSQIQKALASEQWYLGLRQAMLMGIRDETNLTDMIFFARHPERDGRKIERSEPDFENLRREWLDIREQIVRPFLANPPSTTAGISPPPQAATDAPISPPITVEPPRPARPGKVAVPKVLGNISVPIQHMVPGIDVSHHKKRIDWKRVAGEGIRYAYIKATEGRTFQDPLFPSNWKGAKASGIIRGAFHVLKKRSSSSVEAQAQNFLNTVKLSPGDMPPALDVEPEDLEKIIAEEGVANAWKFIYQWVELVKQATGYTPVLYINISALGPNKSKFNFGKLPTLDLWIPSYPNDKPKIKNLPPLPLDGNGNLVWQQWRFWQYSERGLVAGVPSNVDLNLFNGNDDDFKRWLQQVQPWANP